MEFEIKTLLSGILIFGQEGYAECCDLINDESFENLYAQLIFSAFRDLSEENKEFRLSNVLSKCTSYGLDEDSFDYLKEFLTSDCESMKVLREFAVKIHIRNTIDKQIESHSDCIDKLREMNNEVSEDEIFSLSEKTFSGSTSKISDNRSFGDTVSDLVDHFAENPTESIGIPLPWLNVNNSIGSGMRNGVTLVGARSGVGKTSIAVMAAVYMAEQGIPVLMLDTEMTHEDIGPRFIANISGIKINDIETGKFIHDDFKNNLIRNAQNKLKELPISHKEVAGKPFNELLSIIRRWIFTDVGLDENGKSKPCFVIYDYFKLMSSNDLSNNINESQAMGFQISQLTDFCNKFKLPCLSFVQLNRSGIDKEDTSTIFGSDKLLHLCNAFSIFKPKTIEEQIKDGPENGNRKWNTLKSRYGGEHAPNEYVSMTAHLDTCRLLENGLIRRTFKQKEEPSKSEL